MRWKTLARDVICVPPEKLLDLCVGILWILSSGLLVYLDHSSSEIEGGAAIGIQVIYGIQFLISSGLMLLNDPNRLLKFGRFGGFAVLIKAVLLAVVYQGSVNVVVALIISDIIVCGIFTIFSMLVDQGERDEENVLFANYHAVSLEKMCRFEKSNLWEKVFFSWINDIVNLASQIPQLNFEDIDCLPQRDQIPFITKDFIDHWKLKPVDQRSLFKSLLHCFGRLYFFMGFVRFLIDSLAFSGPILLGKIVTFVSSPIQEGDEYLGYVYVSILLATSAFGALLQSQYDFYIARISLWMRSCVVTIVYQKSLSMSLKTKNEFSAGEINNLISADCQRIMDFCISFHQVWSLPFQIGLALYLLSIQIGSSLFSGLGVILIIIIANMFITKQIAKTSSEMMKRKDVRIELVNEVLKNYKVMKYFAWENLFSKLIKNARTAEMKYLSKLKYLDALCVYFWATTPALVSLASFSLYYLLENKLTAANVFTSISLFNMLIVPLNAYPWVINGLVEALVSLRRVQKYLVGEEKLNQIIGVNESATCMVEIENLSIDSTAFSSSSKGVQILKNVNLKIDKNELAVISGKVGSGKSTLLLALLSELVPQSGTCKAMGKIAYAPQEPWIISGTIQENILFGCRMNEEFYKKVIRACALEDDFKNLSGGDKSEIGERGINLSGGQRSRIALARALYSDADIYILDDPFSALDSRVSKNLVDVCFLDLLKYKTVILVTHHVSLLQKFHNANVSYYILSEGTLLKQSFSAEKREENKEELLILQTQVSKIEESNPSNGENKLVEEENREIGGIEMNVLYGYVSKVGIFTFLVVMISILLMQASKNVNDLWTSHWVNDMDKSVGDAYFDLIVLAILSGANSIFTLVRSFIFAYGGLKASKSTFTELLDNVLEAPVQFFEVNPLGRILNRFSADTYSIDDQLPFMTNIFFAQLFSIIGSIAVILYAQWYLIILLVPLLVFYLKIQEKYRTCSRELKRLDSVSNSPLFSNFSEVLDGVITIRAFEQQKNFAIQNSTILDVNQEIQFIVSGSRRWLDVRLSIISVFLSTAIALISIVRHHFIGDANPALIGLALAYAFPLTSMFKNLIWSYSESEKQFVSCERVFEYSNITSEVEIMKSPDMQIENWPKSGSIEFSNFRLKYRSDLEYVLKGISFTVNHGEHVGICGRTGSGKSSLFEALFRMRKYCEGDIYIAGINTKDLSLGQLRSSLCIIPQQPVLLKGTIRRNLDPNESFNTEEIWNAIQKCGLYEKIRNIDGQLESEITTGGENFSVGERQLLCLARAFLQNSKIVCLDEATASIDMEMESMIQSVLKNEFRDRTTLVIAHRIETILEMDKILVLDNGNIQMYGTPSELLNDEDFKQRLK